MWSLNCIWDKDNIYLGIPEYGCELNLAKCLANEKFNIDSDFQPKLSENRSTVIFNLVDLFYALS